MTQAADLLVTNVTFAGPSTGWMPERGWLAIRNGVVSAIGGAGHAEPAAARIMDGRQGVLLPGLRNAHTHGSEILARGVADGLPLGDWLATVWPKLDGLKPGEAALAALFGAMLSIRCGVTAIVDHMRRNPMSDEVVEAVAGAYRESGVRALLAVMVRDRVGEDNRQVGASHLGAPEPAARQLERIERLAGRCTDRRIGFGIGPSASVRCTDDMLQGIAEVSVRRGMPVHIHVAETEAEVADDRRAFGMSAVGRLQHFGLIRRSTALAHAVWLDDADLEIVADGESVVVHNPVSNLRLGSGIADLAGFHRRGIPVAIGTDGAASNDGVDLWESLKFAALLPRRNGSADGSGPHRRMLDSVTVTGQSALGPATGPLPFAVGSAADFCLYPAADMPFAEGDAFAAGLMLAGPRRPSHVMVAGRVILEDGRFPHIDEAEVLADIRQLTREVLA